MRTAFECSGRSAASTRRTYDASTSDFERYGAELQP